MLATIQKFYDIVNPTGSRVDVLEPVIRLLESCNAFRYTVRYSNGEYEVLYGCHHRNGPILDLTSRDFAVWLDNVIVPT